MATLEQLKGQLVTYAHKLGSRHWVANHDGNLSVRVGPDEFLCTPTAVHKSEIDHTMLITVDISGKVLSGDRRVFSEWELHAAAYSARADVSAVMHSHAPYATACAVAGIGFDAPIMVEPVVSLGENIPLVPFFAPKDAAGLSTLQQFASGADALLLENHGVLTLGPSLETAFLRMELVEHQAKIRTLARHWGGARALDASVVQPLLEARAKAGLQTPAEKAGESVDLRGTIARIVAEELSNQA